MLDLKKRIAVIENLLKENSVQSVTYAALECRLTIEFLCYERFKLNYSYLSAKDLKKWQPIHVVKQISNDIDELINQDFTLSISKPAPNQKPPTTKEEYESFNYVKIGHHSSLDLNKLHRLWNALSNISLHIPIENIYNEKLRFYGDKNQIISKINESIDYFKTLKGNLLIGGTSSHVFSFNCLSCNTTIKTPIEKLSKPKYLNCLNPQCEESYHIEKHIESDEFEVTRRIVKFTCEHCSSVLEIPRNVISKLRFKEQLNIICQSCSTQQVVVMRPVKL